LRNAGDESRVNQRPIMKDIANLTMTDA